MLTLFNLILYLLIGGFAGLLAGMFGLGGGILIVPGLAIIFAHLNIPAEYIMHLAAGTSLAIMVVTSASAAFAHYKLGSVRFDLVRSMLPGILAGVVLGSIAASYLNSQFLLMVLAGFLMVVSVLMFRSSLHGALPSHNFPGKSLLATVSSVIGFFSGLLGIGSGSLSIPFLARFGVSMNHSAAVSASCTFFVALIGTTSFMITGWGVTAGLAYATAYVYWPAFLMVAIASMCVAPLGARLSTRLSGRSLKRLFSICLFLLAFKMLI